jgi:long-chain acyl-CoA synthetase
MVTEVPGAETLSGLLLRHAEQRGGAPAVRIKRRGIWHTQSWRALADEVAALAAALSARGLAHGGHLALVGDNTPRLLAAMGAAHRLGAVAVPLFTEASAEELLPLLQSAGVTHVYAQDQEQVDKLLKILPRCPAVVCIVYDNDRGMRHYAQPQLASYAELLAKGHEAAAPADGGHAQDAAFLFYTSGTTGPSKGVVMTHAAMIDRARVAAAIDGLDSTDVALAYLPPAWIVQNLYGYVLPLVVGSCICCPESSETMLADMREMGPSLFLAPPRVLEALLTHVYLRMEDAGPAKRALYRHCIALARRAGPRILSGEPVGWADRIAFAAADLLIYGPLRDVLGLSRVRVAYAAGEAIGPELLMFFRSIGINLKQLYGSTESGGFVAMQRDGAVRPDSVGPAIEGVELKITADREVLVRSRGLFKEYHRDPAATTQSTNDGWYRTGDAGVLGEDGHLRIIDRLQDVGALSDGTLYAPRLLENKLRYSPYVKEAVAFGDGRDAVCMLIDIDPATVGHWADKRGISYTGHADLASRSEVYGLIAACITQTNAELAGDAALARCQTHRFVILPKGLDADDGVLTRLRKLRRGVIAELYRPLVDALYDGRASVQFDAETAYGDGRSARVSAEVPVGEVRVHVGAAAQRAA